MNEVFCCVMRGLIRKKGRSLLTIIGIAIGVTAVIIISNISQCGAVAVSSELDSLGVGGLSVSLDNTNADSDAVLSDNELNIIKTSSYVEKAMPLIFQTATVNSRGENTQALLWGIDQNAKEVISLKLMYGRFINKGDIATNARVCLGDIATNARVCLVDESFAKENFGYSNIVGRKITALCSGNYENFEVIGVIKTGSGLLQNMMGNYIPTFMYLSYTTMQELYAMSDFHRIAVKISDGAEPDIVGEKLVKALSTETGFQNSYIVESMAKQKEGLSQLMNIVTMILSAVGGVSLFVASLSIMNVMLVSVGEKKREIGIKKAIGACRGDILNEFLIEAFILTMSGSILGVILGIVISFIGAFMLGISIIIRYDIIAFTVIFALFTGIVFGIYPANKASKLKPVDALRGE